MKINKFYLVIVITFISTFESISTFAAGPVIPAGTRTILIADTSGSDQLIQELITGSPYTLLQNVIRIRSNTYNDGLTYGRIEAYLGVAGPNIPGVTAGMSFLVVKREVTGVSSVARASRIETINFSACFPDVAPYAWKCQTKGVDEGGYGHTTNSNLGLVPDFGLSALEPERFTAPYNTINEQPTLTAVELARLSKVKLNQLMLGIVATDSVTSNTHISRSKYGSLLSGKMSDWRYIDGTQDPVVICRQVNGSGIQAAYNWFFTGFPCNTASGGYVDSPLASVSDSFGYDGSHTGSASDPYTVEPSQGFTVIENETPKDVANCLTAAQYGTDFVARGAFGKYYKVLFSQVAGTPTPHPMFTSNVIRGGPSKAIGTLALSSYNVAASTNSGFSFRQLDGAGLYNPKTQVVSTGATGMSPSKVNLMNGNYDFVVEPYAYRRNTAVINVNGDTVPALSSDSIKNAFFNEFVKRAGSTRYIGNNGGTYSTVSQAYATLPITSSYEAIPNFVSKYSRNGNTCAPLVLFPSL